ncbi:MAG: phage holin family protein [Cytophagaceae bacterium]|nr:phage holin family protein [Cytophagaceae bacterium]MBK9933903.1 phage holin family protein [Cytophagaceae bacterium]MBL0325208.1 phage holin family protein [Cytophagaceae bacterium]
MINYIVRLVIIGAIVMIVPRYLKGIYVDSFLTGVIVAFVMSILNTFVKPILKFISIPVTFMTLGLFSLVISVLMVYVCDYLVDGFNVTGFLPPLLLSILISVSNSLVGLFQPDKKDK